MMTKSMRISFLAMTMVMAMSPVAERPGEDARMV